ncbi:unnamed protein product [Vicia faba]|uniref:phospholipase A2 n=1 Tax=Vicia faba TaxID=3906 RepID=A0AAV0ZAT3_VICFA|nr:unnamed protein product [Vicia faba]
MTTRVNISRATAAFALVSLLLSAVFHFSAADGNCSTKCIAEQCDTMGIKYGKYCGVGHSGCIGQKPCDDVDACCMVHDDCVGEFGMTNVKCHNEFKKCLTKVQKSGKVGFSKRCPISTVVPTMTRGMDLAIMLSQFSENAHEL